MPRTETRTLFTFAELSPESQARAIECYRDSGACAEDASAWDHEWRKARAAMVRLFEGDLYATLRWYSYDGSFREAECPSSLSNMDAEPLTGLRLRTYILNNLDTVLVHDDASAKAKRRAYLRTNRMPETPPSWFAWSEPGELNNCPFTGTAMDECYLDPLRAFLADPRKDGMLHWDMDDLARECFQAGDAAWEAEHEYAHSDDAIRTRLSDGIDGVEYTEDGTQA